MNLIGNSLFTGAISGLNANYLLLLNGQQGLSLENILNPKTDAIKYTVDQNFRSFLLNNFNSIDMDGDGKITNTDFTNYSAKLRTQGMTYAEISQLCSTGYTGSMSSLLDTVLSNFNEIDTNHDGRITQVEINAYRVNKEIKDVKKDYPKIDPTRMSVFYDANVNKTDTTSKSENKVFS